MKREEILTHEEILDLLYEYPIHTILFYKTYPDKVKKEHDEWKKIFVPKLEAFLKDRAVPKDVEKQLRKIITEEFLHDFEFADRYYEKNELMYILAEMKKRIETKVLAVVGAQRAQLKKLQQKRPPLCGRQCKQHWNDWEKWLEELDSLTGDARK